jgi:hypothetical protein
MEAWLQDGTFLGDRNTANHWAIKIGQKNEPIVTLPILA